MLVTRARDNAAYFAFCNLVGGQDELVFDGHSVVLDDEGEVVARAPGFEEALLVVDLDPNEAIGQRLRDVRRRELERSRTATPTMTTLDLAPAREPEEPVAASVTPFASELEQLRLGARARPSRLRRQERLRRRPDLDLGGRRLGAHGGGRRRRARPRPRAHHLDAVALQLGGDA